MSNALRKFWRLNYIILYSYSLLHVIASEQREQPNLLHGTCTVIVVFSCGGLLRSFHSLAMTRKILKFARNYGERTDIIAMAGNVTWYIISIRKCRISNRESLAIWLPVSILEKLWGRSFFFASHRPNCCRNRKDGLLDNYCSRAGRANVRTVRKMWCFANNS